MADTLDAGFAIDCVGWNYYSIGNCHCQRLLDTHSPLRVVAVMVELHGAVFMETATQIRGRARNYFAHAPAGMTQPAQVTGTAIWMETNFSAANIRTLCDRIVTAFGHGQAEVWFE